MTFKDHFSNQAELYAKSRPHYPKELYQYLAGLTQEHKLAWDCATGNGQAAVALSEFYDKVIGTDASASQIENAAPYNNVEYRIALAEDSKLPGNSVDIVTVATAIHWFDLEPFYHEVKRVLKPGGIIAAWSYFELKMEEKLEKTFKKLVKEILKNYWSPDLKKVASGYKDIPFPFEEIIPPAFNAVTNWNKNDFIDYLHTISFVQKYVEVNGKDPIDEVRTELDDAWRNPEEIKTITWPLLVKTGRV